MLTGSRDRAATCFGGESARRFAEKMQKPQPALQGGDVVIRRFGRTVITSHKMKTLDYLMKIDFMQPQRRPTFFTACTIDLNCSITAYMECSL